MALARAGVHDDGRKQQQEEGVVRELEVALEERVRVCAGSGETRSLGIRGELTGRVCLPTPAPVEREGTRGGGGQSCAGTRPLLGGEGRSAGAWRAHGGKRGAGREAATPSWQAVRATPGGAVSGGRARQMLEKLWKKFALAFML